MRPDGQSSRSLDFRLGVSACVVALSVILAGSANANHSVPNPRHFYDEDNDGIAEASDSDPAFQKLGNGWDIPKEQRYKESLDAWRLNTDFNPTLAVAAVNGLYVDGRNPVNCTTMTWAQLGNPAGVTCQNEDFIVNHFDIIQSWVYLNTGIGVWWTGVSNAPAGQVDLRGVMTHELGHTVLLLDLYGGGNCPPGPTMCGSVTVDQTSALRSLASDDIGAANLVYLP